MPDRSVLIVDDDADLLDLLRDAFENAGFQVATAANGQIALRLLARTPVSVLVTDILMPVKDGIETIREAKGLRPDLKAIAMSGGGRLIGVECLQWAKTVGADCALCKPFKSADMIACALSLLDIAHAA